MISRFSTPNRAQQNRQRRENVPLRLVAVGSTKLEPPAQIKLKFTASRQLAYNAHANLAGVFSLLVGLRLIDILQKATINGSGAVSAWFSIGLVVIIVLVLMLKALLRQRPRVIFLSTLSVLTVGVMLVVTPWAVLPTVSVLLVHAAPHIPNWVRASRKWLILRAGFKAHRMKSFEAEWLGCVPTFCAYLVAALLLLPAHNQFLSDETVSDGIPLKPFLLALSLIVALLVPWIICYRSAPGFGELEWFGSNKNKARLHSTAFDLPIELWPSEAHMIFETLHDRAKDRFSFILVVVKDLLNPERRIPSAASTVIDGDAKQASLSRIFLRREIDRTPAVATFASAASIMPGLALLILCMIFQIATTVELAVVGMGWAVYSVRSIYDMLRGIPLSLKIEEDDERALAVPLIRSQSERETLNSDLDDKFQMLVKLVGGLVFGIAVAVLLGLLAIDAARTDWPRNDCLLFERCAPENSGVIEPEFWLVTRAY